MPGLSQFNLAAPLFGDRSPLGGYEAFLKSFMGVCSFGVRVAGKECVKLLDALVVGVQLPVNLHLFNGRCGVFFAGVIFTFNHFAPATEGPE